MSKSKAILITAFEPFGGESINPSQQILNELPDIVNGYRIEKVLLPVEFIEAPSDVINGYDKIEPMAVIMLGQAGGRNSISIETTGKNLMNARIPDAKGYQPQNEKIVPEGKDSIISTLPNNKIIDALNKVNIPVSLSNDAGGYVCNAVLYLILNHNKGLVPTGFIHIPYAKEQGHSPFMEFRDMFNAIITIINVVIEEFEVV